MLTGPLAIPEPTNMNSPATISMIQSRSNDSRTIQERSGVVDDNVAAVEHAVDIGQVVVFGQRRFANRSGIVESAWLDFAEVEAATWQCRAQAQVRDQILDLCVAQDAEVSVVECQ